MSIVWKYLDKKAAVINVLKDYNSMKYIIENSAEDIKIEYENMASVPSPTYDELPRSKSNFNGIENRMLKGIEAIDVLRERYRQAIEYMRWFTPAWLELTEDERFVLSEFYMVDSEKQIDAVYNVCDELKIERSSAYNKKNRALVHLALLLYGKE